jgi:hypothetical protein
MPINRTYSFDIDTKKYLNRVNTFRGLNGLSNIAMADAVDIDNFVVGLKDLGAWNNTVFWLYGTNYGTSATRSVIPLNTLNYNYDRETCTLSTTISAGLSGVTCPAGSNITGVTVIADPTEITVGFIGTAPTAGTNGNWFAVNNVARVDGSSALIFWLNPRTGFGGEFRFANSNAVLAENTLTGFRSWIYTGRFGEQTIIFRDGVLAATAGTSAGRIPFNSQPIAISFCRSGTYDGTAAIAFISKRKFPNSVAISMHSLIRSTVGKRLGLV